MQDVEVATIERHHLVGGSTSFKHSQWLFNFAKHYVQQAKMTKLLSATSAAI